MNQKPIRFVYGMETLVARSSVAVVPAVVPQVQLVPLDPAVDLWVLLEIQVLLAPQVQLVQVSLDPRVLLAQLQALLEIQVLLAPQVQLVQVSLDPLVLLAQLQALLDNLEMLVLLVLRAEQAQLDL